MGLWDTGGISHSWVYILLPGSCGQSPKWGKAKRRTTTMERTVFHHIDHMITSTRITEELYENYYWVEPEELLTAGV